MEPVRISNIYTPNYSPVKTEKAETKKEVTEKKEINLNNDPVSQNAGKLIQAKASAKQKVLKDKFQACLLGGAIGDAVGRPIERVRIKDIYRRYGESGIQDMATVGLRGRITDDTQMTIFTTDGLIKSALSGKTNN